jgi:hypothetical protein
MEKLGNSKTMSKSSRGEYNLSKSGNIFTPMLTNIIHSKIQTPSRQQKSDIKLLTRSIVLWLQLKTKWSEYSILNWWNWNINLTAVYSISIRIYLRIPSCMMFLPDRGLFAVGGTPYNTIFGFYRKYRSIRFYRMDNI